MLYFFNGKKIANVKREGKLFCTCSQATDLGTPYLYITRVEHVEEEEYTNEIWMVDTFRGAFSLKQRPLPKCRCLPLTRAELLPQYEDEKHWRQIHPTQLDH